MGNFLGLLVIMTILLASSGSAWRHKRQVVIQQRQPVSDRSVYARRNFAQPDVVSDIYEVYVGSSKVIECLILLHLHMYVYIS